MKKSIATGIFLLVFLAIKAQQPLSLSDAVALALENNYDIKVAGNQLLMAHNNNTAGSAGYLPTLSLNSNYSENISTSRQEYYDGRQREATNARSNSLTAGATLQWTLFDGMEMFLTDKQLDSYEQRGETVLRYEVEGTTATVITAYLSAVQQIKRLEVLREALRYDRELLTLARKKFLLGVSSELDYLKTLADLNTDSAAFLQQEVSLTTTFTSLNTLLALPPSQRFLLTDSIAMLSELKYDEVFSPLASNSQLRLASLQSDIARYEARIARAVQYPVLSFTAGYNYTKANSATGLIESNKNYGPNAGITLSYTLFNGFRTRQRIRNADITLLNTELEAEQTRQAIEATLYTVFANYQAHLKLVNLHSDNLKTVTHNLQVALEAYRVGQLAGIDLRQYQLQQLEAHDDFLMAQYNLKVLETELMRISGRIVQ